jgi:hypothetical protein
MASKIRRSARQQFDAKGLMAIRLAFAHKFGRLPRGDDPVFFDPHGSLPYSLPSDAAQRLLLEAMLEIGTAPELVYALCRTGFAVSGDARGILPPEQVSRWDMAIDEYLAFKAKTDTMHH